MLRAVRSAAAAILLMMAAISAVHAQDAASFYRGKTVTIIVGYGVGGGYDIYGRLLSRVLGKYIPGNPNVIVQNMPGAGSLRAANFLYKVAPSDGTVIGTFARNIPLLGMKTNDPNVQYDPHKFTWLGSSRTASRSSSAAAQTVQRATQTRWHSCCAMSWASTSSSSPVTWIAGSCFWPWSEEKSKVERPRSPPSSLTRPIGLRREGP